MATTPNTQPTEQAGEDVPDRLRALADLWDRQRATYPNTDQGRAAEAAVRLCTRELRATFDAPPKPRKP